MSLLNLADFTARPQGADSHLEGECKEHGKYTVEAFYYSGNLRNPDPLCPRCVIADSRSAAKVEFEQKRFDGVGRMIAYSQISPRMIDCKIENYDPVNDMAKANRKICQHFVENWTEPNAGRRNLIMVGNPGTGKTHLGTAIALAVIRSYAAQALYTRADDLASYIRGSYAAGATYSEEEAIQRFGDVPLLVLDELGATPAKEHERSLLSRVIDMRWLNMRPTITMSNLMVAELETATDERMMDRLRDGATAMVFDWASYRGMRKGSV